MKNIKKVYVHGGCFHADDAMAVAMLKIVFPNIQVERVFKVPELREDEIAVDIGGGRYDHHQEDAELRPNGHKYAACGLVFRELKREIFPNGVSSGFLSILNTIQNLDNGIQEITSEYGSMLSRHVSMMNPEWDSKETPDEAFMRAVEYCQEEIKFFQTLAEKPFDFYESNRLFHERLENLEKANETLWQNHQEAAKRAEDIVRTALNSSNGKIVVLPQFCPWADVLVLSTAEFVIFPSNRGGVMLQCVPPELQSFEKKVPLPEEWLKERPKGAIFVHQGRFIANFQTEEQAMAAAQSIYEGR